MPKAKKIQYQIIYWRDIPVQLRLRCGRKRLSYALPDVFQKTVYRAAYRARAITGDGYEEGWHPEGWFEYEQGPQDGQGASLEAAGEALASELVEAYGEERLNALALNKGYEQPASKNV